MSIYWLSFANGSLPKGSQFIGACMLEADSLMAAVLASHALGINPGGEIQALELPPGADVHPSWLGVLMDRATIEKHDTPAGWATPRDV